MPPIQLTLEYAVEFIADDELVEITPKSIRIRKRYLKEHERKKAAATPEPRGPSMSTATKDDPRSPGDSVEELLEQRLAVDPKDAIAHRAIAEMKQARGDELGRLAHLIAAQTLEAYVSGRPAGALTELGKVPPATS